MFRSNVSQKKYYRKKLRTNVIKNIFVILSQSGFFVCYLEIYSNVIKPSSVIIIVLQCC